MSTYKIKYLDGEVREVPNVEETTFHDGVLRMFGSSVYGRRDLILAVVLANVKEWEVRER